MKVDLTPARPGDLAALTSIGLYAVHADSVIW